MEISNKFLYYTYRPYYLDLVIASLRSSAFNTTLVLYVLLLALSSYI